MTRVTERCLRCTNRDVVAFVDEAPHPSHGHACSQPQSVSGGNISAVETVTIGTCRSL